MVTQSRGRVGMSTVFLCGGLATTQKLVYASLFPVLCR